MSETELNKRITKGNFTFSSKWVPVVKYSLTRVQEMCSNSTGEKKLCSDYEGALDAHRNIILDCAIKLDQVLSLIDNETGDVV